MEIGVYQKAPPIGGYFGEVLESLHLLRLATLVNGRRMELNFIMHPTHPTYHLFGR